jgi:hypothetical protein
VRRIEGVEHYRTANSRSFASLRMTFDILLHSTLYVRPTPTTQVIRVQQWMLALDRSFRGS